MKPSDLEMKFHEILIHSPKPLTLYLRADTGYIKIVYRNKWDDGLSNISLLRVQNTRLGTSTAPASWEHLTALLELHKVELSEFEIALNRRAEIIIRKSQQSLVTMKELFGDEYVDDILKSDSLTGELINVLRRSLNKPTLSIIKGGNDT